MGYITVQRNLNILLIYSIRSKKNLNPDLKYYDVLYSTKIPYILRWGSTM